MVNVCWFNLCIVTAVIMLWKHFDLVNRLILKGLLPLLVLVYQWMIVMHWSMSSCSMSVDNCNALSNVSY